MFSIRIPFFVFLFLLFKTVLGQQKEATVIESKQFNQSHRDTLKANKKISLDEKVKQISNKRNKKPSNKKPPKKRIIPYVKPMDEVSINGIITKDIQPTNIELQLKNMVQLNITENHLNCYPIRLK